MIEIIQGEDKVIIARLKDENNDPVDLTNASAISVSFAQSDDTDLELHLAAGITVPTPLLGIFHITLTDTQTALLTPVSNATMQVKVTIASSDKLIQLQRAYSVIENLF
jgi:hypothetical protein